MIEINDLSWSAGNREILKDISFKINPNDFIAIIGPNGAGKSTLLKLILNLLPIQTGSIVFKGISHTEYLKNNPIAYLPQKEETDSSFPIKVIDVILLGRMFYKKLLRGFTKTDIQTAEHNLDIAGISHLKDKLISSLSGGEFQRMLLARALTTGSDYIFLDEPEAGIDRKGVLSFFTLLKQLNNSGKTIITISHDLHILSDYCTKLICLNKTLHCHKEPSLMKVSDFNKTFGDNFHIIHKDY